MRTTHSSSPSACVILMTKFVFDPPSSPPQTSWRSEYSSDLDQTSSLPVRLDEVDETVGGAIVTDHTVVSP